MAATTTPQGESLFGTPQSRGAVGVIADQRQANNPGYVRFNTMKDDKSAVLDFYMWFDENGNLRINNGVPVDQNNDGVVIGTV